MKITNYKVKDFLLLDDSELIEQYMVILELLPPATEITDPRDEIKTIKLKRVDSLKFGQVNQLRELLSDGEVNSIYKAIMLITELPVEEIPNIRIMEFYSIINRLRSELIEITERENAYLVPEETDPILEEAKVGQRLARFGVMNTIDNLAGGDITKYKEVEELPYLLVFSKLLRDKEVAEINKEIEIIQRRKLKQ